MAKPKAKAGAKATKKRKRAKTPKVPVEIFPVRQISVQLMAAGGDPDTCPIFSLVVPDTIIICPNMSVFCFPNSRVVSVFGVPPMQPSDLTPILKQLAELEPLTKSVVVVATPGKLSAARAAIKRANG
jgi:hypothetical protein